MATLSIDIPTGQVTRVNDAFAANFSYTGFLADGITPITKANFTKAKVIEWMKLQVRQHEATVAAALAYQTAQDSVETGVTLT